MEAINLLLGALAKPGDIVAVELPTYHAILQDAIGKYLENGQYDKLSERCDWLYSCR